MSVSPFLKKLYLTSLTPFELLAFSKTNKGDFIKKEDPKYLNLWKNSIEKDNSDEVFKKYCTYNKFDANDISLMTSKIEDFSEDIDLPLWTQTLNEVLSTIHPEYVEYNNENQEKAFYHLFFPFIDFFSSKLQKVLQKSDIETPNQNICDQLNEALYKSLFDIAYLVLFKEFESFKEDEINDVVTETSDFYYKKFVTNVLSDQFQKLFLTYPILAKKLATTTHDYLKFIIGFFERLTTDKSEIEYSFGTKISQLSQLHLNSGDQHNGGSAIIVEFDNLYKIVYKPTNIVITNAYNKFLDWVNISLHEKLKSFKVIDKNIYGWLEFVDHIECNTIDDIKLYYKRAGILAGVAYFLNARDYHLENVIASGNCPVLIDHETTIGPNIKMFSGKTTSELSKNSIVGTVLETLLLPTKDKGVPLYACGFGSSTQLEQSFVIPKIENCNTDNMQRIPVEVYKELHKSNKPKLNNKVENLSGYQSEFKEGFDKIYNLISENKQLLLSENSPLQYFKNIPIRFINRPTEVYFKILKFLNKPEYLRDGNLYGLKLEILARAYTVYENWSSILNSEREQMLTGDIPVFYTNTLSDSLTLPNGDIIDIIESSAIETVNQKINKANQHDYSRQINLINEAIAL